MLDGAAAEQFAALGYDVAVGWSGNQKAADTTMDVLDNISPSGHFLELQGDITDPDIRGEVATELEEWLDANVEMIDPHRIFVTGPTTWRASEVVCPPALRPAVIILIAMLAAEGVSTLRNVYSINRGYEDLANRLNELGAEIRVIRDI